MNKLLILLAALVMVPGSVMAQCTAAGSVMNNPYHQGVPGATVSGCNGPDIITGDGGSFSCEANIGAAFHASKGPCYAETWPGSLGGCVTPYNSVVVELEYTNQDGCGFTCPPFYMWGIQEGETISRSSTTKKTIWWNRPHNGGGINQISPTAKIVLLCDEPLCFYEKPWNLTNNPGVFDMDIPDNAPLRRMKVRIYNNEMNVTSPSFYVGY